MCLPPLWAMGLFSFAECEDMKADMVFQDLTFCSKNLSQPGWPCEQKLSMIIAYRCSVYKEMLIKLLFYVLMLFEST